MTETEGRSERTRFARGDDTAEPAADFLAAGCAGCWLLGATASRWVGVWPGIAGTGITLGALSLLLQGGLLVRDLRPTRPAILYGLLSAAVMLAATYGLYPFSTPWLPGLADQTAVLYTRFGTISGITLVLLPLAILSEELIWRGLVQRAITRRVGPIGGALLSALIYGAAHLPAGAWLAALALTCGVFWSLLRARTRSLLVPLLAHLAWDFAVMVWFPLVGR